MFSHVLILCSSVTFVFPTQFNGYFFPQASMQFPCWSKRQFISDIPLKKIDSNESWKLVVVFYLLLNAKAPIWCKSI